MRDNTKPFTVALTGKAAILAAIFCSFAASAVEVIAHTGDKEVPLVLELCGRNKLRPSPSGGGVKYKVRECRITDETRTNEIIPLPSALPPHSFLVVTVERCRGN